MAQPAPADDLHSTGTWSVISTPDEMRIFFYNGVNAPQYGALHLKSSYFRLVYGPTSGWGTSVILLPVVWVNGKPGPDQGAPVKATWEVKGQNLVIHLTGTIATLCASSDVTISPPVGKSITAKVASRVKGTVSLANRPGEAFKTVMLSSMHISPTMWDTRLAYAGLQRYAIPDSGWILSTEKHMTESTFGLVGGTSSYKTNAPTIQIKLDRPMQIAGWVTKSSDTNDDNVGYWAAANSILTSWNYTITASDDPHNPFISGIKFNDKNRNGRRDAGEPGLSGWTIKLAKPDGTTAVTTTDAYGNYKFANLKPGLYNISEVVKVDWARTYPANPGVHTVRITSIGPDITGKNFGNVKIRFFIAGAKFNDKNGNGKRDSSEPGIAGWAIKMTKPDGRVVTTNTDSRGNYVFSSLPPGTYKVSEASKIGWTRTYPASPGIHTVIMTNADIGGKNFGNKQAV